MFHPHMILYPTDYSECSTYAWEIAADLARQYQAKIVILHVAETLGPENVTFGEAATQLEPAAYRRRLEEDLRRQVPAPPGVSVDYVLVQGDTAQQIQRVAQEHNCDVIVMGTHGLTGLRRLVIGSTAEKVVSLANCPVLITKIPPKQALPTD